MPSSTNNDANSNGSSLPGDSDPLNAMTNSNNRDSPSTIELKAATAASVVVNAIASSATSATSGSGHTTGNTNGRPPTPPEQPIHSTYLREFRVEQCPLFIQHKCTQHKPFTCFHWHFQNQRRRRPVRRKDGTFNYSPDNYCTKYDETTGNCPDGDETAGDTERRYHLRYYKTGICVYETDQRGFCVKNGAHCAFAHGVNDLRSPQYDSHELALHALDEQENNLNAINGGSIDKERGALNEDPRWQDSSFVLANYKTELCKKPPRLCRQGYACPQFHNGKDRRRSPRLYKYRSTPCPSVKQSDEWGDPANCDNGDSCHYCHTRTEQQFHPEIYKSSKCNDVQQTGYCPRGPFCAFAHNDQEMNAERELSMEGGSELASMFSVALSNGQSEKNAQLDGSNNSSHSNSGSLVGGLPIGRGGNNFTTSSQFGSIGSLGQQFMAGSMPTHFGFGDLGVLGAQGGGSGGNGSPLQQSMQGTASGSFHRGTSPPTLNGVGSGHAPPGPIARPRSYSSSHTSNLPSCLANRETLLNSYLKLNSTLEEKARLNAALQQRSHLNSHMPVRKVSTPSTLFASSAAPGSISGSGTNSMGNLAFNSLGNLAAAAGSGALNGQATAAAAAAASGAFYGNGLDTVESVVGSALDDFMLDDLQLEASIEKELAGQGLGEEQRTLAGSALMARSAGTLLGSTAPVNIPANAAQRSNIGNLGSPPIGFSQSPFSRPPTSNISSSVGSSLYEFASHNSGLSPGQQNTFGQQVANQQNQAYLLEIQRLREELVITRNKSDKNEQDLKMIKQACEYWKKEAEKALMEKEEAERRSRSDQIF